MDVLKETINSAKKNNVSTIVVASTTGKTAAKLLELVKPEKLKIIVVTYNENVVRSQKFDENIRKRLLDENIAIYMYNLKPALRKIIGRVMGKLGFPTWQRYLKKVREKYGTGIKVCHIIVQMLMEGKMLKGGRVAAIAGTKSGADSSAIFLAVPGNKRPVLEKIIINHL